MSDLPRSSLRRALRASANGVFAANPAQGVILALGATCFWSLFPLLFKAVTHINALEVLAHRSLWTLVFAAAAMVVTGRREIFVATFYAPRILGGALFSGLAIAVNWGTFIWAVNHDQVLQSSLGYFISPLVSVLLAVAFLRERLGVRAWAAVALATAGVLLLVFRFGAIPWAALVLAFSWAFYGLVRKLAPIGSLPGLYLETMLLAPLALAYIAWLGLADGAVVPVFGANWGDSALLVATGAVTAFPLLLFTRAVRILRLSTLGLLMYLVPTGQFLLAVFIFDEPFTLAHLWAFALIWLGLALYGWDSLERAKPAPATT